MYNSQTINAKHRQDLRQASMSTWTQACKLSMPNQWARSHRLQCQHGQKHANYQYQTNGHDIIGFNVNQTLAHKLAIPNQ